MSQMDSNNHTTYFTYDNMNRRKSRKLPGGQTETYDTYDATGNLIHKTTFNGKSISYAYTNLDDRLQSESFSEGSIVFNYDGFLRRQSMTDISGTTTYTYDARDRMKTKNNTTYGNLTYGYDYHGNIASIASSNPGGANMSYLYDALNRPTTVTDSHRGILTTTYSYDAIGNLSGINLPNGVAVTYAYDQLNRLNSMASLLTSNAATVASYTYTLGPTGNRLSVNEYSNRNVQWTYDDLYRLTGEVIQQDPAGNNGSIGYTYDPVGNRNIRSTSVTPITSQNFTGQYDPNDRLTAGYTYDNDGNTLTDPSGKTYTYDTLDRMVTVTGTGLNETFLYDGDGNKASQTVNGTTTNYLIDSNNLTGYAQVMDEMQGGSAVTRTYTYGTSRISQDRLLSIADWQLSFYGYDGQGSVRYLMDGTGNVTDTYTLDSFGNSMSSTGTTPNNYQYDGEQLDANTGFYNLRARWMKPSIGRFQTMDSYEGDKKILYLFIDTFSDRIIQLIVLIRVEEILWIKNHMFFGQVWHVISQTRLNLYISIIILMILVGQVVLR